MFSEKLKKGLLASALAATCVFSMGIFAACGCGDEDKDNSNKDKAQNNSDNVTTIRIETVPVNSNGTAYDDSHVYELIEKLLELQLQKEQQAQDATANKQKEVDQSEYQSSKQEDGIVKVAPKSINDWIVYDNGNFKTYGEVWNEFKTNAEKLRDEKIEYYKNKSGADGSTQLIKDSFKVEAAVIVDGVRYNPDCNFKMLSRIVNAAKEVNFEFSYYFEANGYTIIEWNIMNNNHDKYSDSKTYTLIKTTLEVDSEYYYAAAKTTEPASSDRTPLYGDPHTEDK
ncbi:MAG: hypothetical protein IKQ31_01095 [Clostridia bacterium]|nr:hypothetical protein [Clostridia bacterium]